MKASLDRLLSLVLVGCAVVLTGLVVRREVRARSSALGTEKPEYVTDWQALLEIAIPLASGNRAIQVVEFADLECPACRRFSETLKGLQSREFSDVGVAWIHFPLSYHRFALPGARALECADAQGVAKEFIDAVFQAQDSIGLKNWEEIAATAGVPEPSEVANCAANPDIPRRVQQGIEAGRRLEIRGTPTILINGWRFPFTPSPSDLRAAIQAIRDNNAPFAHLRNRP